ncbi:MAG: 2OG-Fe(II) oxygenase [Rudaea sp.]
MNTAIASVRVSPQSEKSVERPLPAELGTCVVIHDFLSAEECAELIARAERRGFHSAESDYPPSYRNNERQIDDDPGFAHALFARLRGFVPQTIKDQDARGSVTTWRVQALNERIRWCRYGPGQRFNIHQDGVHHRGPNCRSRLTFMIYLSGPEAFEGGDTLFYENGPRADGEYGAPRVVARVQPRAGSLIIFDHSIWHAGDTVTRGVKHILRSDLLYECPISSCTSRREPFTPGHEGYVWTLLKLTDRRIASAGRDATIRLWSEGGESEGTLRGHRQSVLGLSEVAPNVLASVSRDRTILLWDLKTRTCMQEIGGHAAAVLSIARLKDGVFATGSADSTIAVRNTSGTTVRMLLGHKSWVWAIVCLDSSTLASASEDGSVRLWDVDQGACVAELPQSQPLRTIDVQSNACVSNDRLLATGDVFGWACIWSVEGRFPKLVARFQAHDAAIRRVRFLSSGRLATCGEDQRLRVWNLFDRRLLFEQERSNFVTDVLEVQNGSLLCSGYEGGLSLIAPI